MLILILFDRFQICSRELNEDEFVNVRKNSCDKKDKDIPEEKFHVKGKKFYNKGTPKDISQH